MKGRWRKIGTLMLAAALLSGCQLAKENQGNDSGDRIFGAFVMMQSERNQLQEDDQIFSPEENIVEGKVNKDHLCEFPDVKGYQLGQYTENEGTQEATQVTACSEEIEDARFDVNIKEDGGEEISVEGTLYVTSQMSEIVYLNFIYQREDGSVYIRPYEGTGSSLNFTTNGEALTQTLTSSTTVNGKERAVKYTINIKNRPATKSVFIKEMNKKDELLKTVELSDRNQSQYKLLDETAYVIVEEKLLKNDQEEFTKRSVYTWNGEGTEEEDMTHTFYYKEENEVMRSQILTFLHRGKN